MRITAHLCVAACIALPGCAALAPMGTPNCTSSPCVVNVTVRSCKEVRIEPHDVQVPRGGGKFVVEWNISGGGPWTFRDPGITFKGSNDEFEDEGKGSKNYKWKYKNSKPGRHYYNTHLTDGRVNCDFDPSIMN